MEAKAHEYYNGREFHFIYHRHFTERSGLDKFTDMSGVILYIKIQKDTCAFVCDCGLPLPYMLIFLYPYTILGLFCLILNTSSKHVMFSTELVVLA